MGRDALKVIGLTGRYCAGKSSIARLLQERGYREIDVDALGHTALNASVDELKSAFSEAVIGSDGSVDRSALKNIVFSDEGQLRILESIVHPQMVRAVKLLIEKERANHAEAVIVNAALLYRMHLDTLCDIICHVHTPYLFRFLRARKRDRATISSFLRVERAQKDISPKFYDGEKTVFLLENRGSESFIHRQVDELCISIGL